MYAHVSKEEWMWRSLAIAMCLAMVGIVVMPGIAGNFSKIQPVDLYFAILNNNKAEWEALAISVGWETALTILEIAVTGGVYLPAAIITWSPVLIE